MFWSFMCNVFLFPCILNKGADWEPFFKQLLPTARFIHLIDYNRCIPNHFSFTIINFQTALWSGFKWSQVGGENKGFKNLSCV